MGAINQYIVIVFLSSFTFVAWAEKTTSHEKVYKEDQIINFAYQKMTGTIELLENKMDQCLESAKKNNLDVGLFKKFELTTEELRAVLFYFLLLAYEKCESKALWEKAIREFAQFKYIEKKYKGKNIITTENTFEQLCCGSVDIKIKAELEYLKVDSDTRRKLEKIPELQIPFNIFRAIESLKL